MAEVEKNAVFRKVTLRLIPLLFLLYVVNILDRGNLGFANLQMGPQLGFTSTVFGYAAGLFYVGYLLFEVPSNLILRRTGARRWISRILISWGLVSAATMFVVDKWSLFLLRILLGFAEAGFFPGMILYLTYWYPARERARAVGWFMTGSPIAGIIGYPVSGAIMQYLDHVGGLRGWQWLFLLEGIPSVILGFVVLRYLPDRPNEARWLTREEGDWLTKQIDQEEQHRERHHGLSFWQSLADWRVWLLICLYFAPAAGSNTMAYFLPGFIKTQFTGMGEFNIGLLGAIAPLCAIVAMTFNSAHSDRTGERRWHVAIPAFLAAVGWAACAWLESPVLFLAALALAHLATMSMLPVFWSLPTAFLSGVAAAGGIAWINSLGNLGGLAGPVILGSSKDATGDYTFGFLAMALILGIGGILALFVRHDRGADH